MSIYLGEQPIAGIVDSSGKANTSLNNLTAAGLKVIKDNSGSGLEVGDISTALYVNEAKNLRRYLNGQIVDNNKNTKVFIEDYLLGLYATNPDYFTTEDNWQAEATLNIDGCVYKFVLNYSGDNVVSVRLPKYPDYVEVSAGSTATTAPIKELGLVPQQGYGVTESGMYWIPAKLTNVGSTDKVNASCKLLSQDGSGAVWLSEIKSGAKGNYFSGYADLSGLNIKTTKLKMRYFIQIATGSETENNIVNDIELNNPYVLFKSEYFEAPPYNLSWLKSDGEYKPKATYIKPYEALVVENNSSIAVGTTVDLPSGTKYTKRGLSVKLSTDESATDYDFRINTADETFRLPLKNGLEGMFASGVKGNGMTLGMTNGSSYGGIQSMTYASGVTQAGELKLYPTNYGSNVGSVGSGNPTDTEFNSYNTLGITTDASKSGMVVDTTVPEGYNLYYYVGETVQNANLIDAGRIGEQLATKASVNDIDGAFVKAVLVLVDGTTYTVGTTHETKTLVQFDISNYLPEDSNEYDYEVRLSSEGYTTTNTSVMLWIDIPSVADISHAWSDQQTTSCGSVGNVVTQIIPKGYKKVSIYLRSGSSSMMFYSHIVGYRRLRKEA